MMVHHPLARKREAGWFPGDYFSLKMVAESQKNGPGDVNVSWAVGKYFFTFLKIQNDPTTPKGILKHGQKTSKEESLIISLLALETELCGHYKLGMIL